MARPRKYRINLTPKERNRIKQAKKRAKGIRKNTRYDIILAADENRYKEVPTYNEIAAKAGVTVQTVIETLKKYCNGGLQEAVSSQRNPNSDVSRLKVTGDKEAHIIAKACSAPPEGVFRDRLLAKEKHCKLCQVDDEQMLVASHIKPWRECLPGERLDVNNGFLMCPNHDKLFDRGLISFDNNGKIMISTSLTKKNRIFLNVSGDMKILLTEGNKKYLQYHRKTIFKK